MTFQCAIGTLSTEKWGDPIVESRFRSCEQSVRFLPKHKTCVNSWIQILYIAKQCIAETKIDESFNVNLHTIYRNWSNQMPCNTACLFCYEDQCRLFSIYFLCLSDFDKTWIVSMTASGAEIMLNLKIIWNVQLS